VLYREPKLLKERMIVTARDGTTLRFSALP